MKTTFLFRNPAGRICSAHAETANQAANAFGSVLAWDGELNTLDILRHGKIENWTFLGHREGVKS